MERMTDPSDALALYQEAFAADSIPLQAGTLDHDLFVAVDQPGGHVRFSYMRVDGKRLSVLVMFAQNGLVDGQPCFNIGYAVAETYRGQRRATETLIAALAGLQHGLTRAGIPEIHIEAVIGVDHAISQKVAGAVFVDPPTEIVDSASGLPALHYIRRISLAAKR
jgi:hypothetical protein